MDVKCDFIHTNMYNIYSVCDVFLGWWIDRVEIKIISSHKEYSVRVIIVFIIDITVLHNNEF